MAQVIVNFRIDEDDKKNMEQACREMGLSMSTAFNIFAKKVGKEKRIPFEISAQPLRPEPRTERRENAGIKPMPGEGPLALALRMEQLDRLCASIRRSLTAIHVAIPSSITGLSMERIRLLCSDELKDKAAAIAADVRALLSARNAEATEKRDFCLLDEYAGALSSAARELSEVERTLIPAMRAWRGDRGESFEEFEQRLAALSREMDELPALMQRFLCSTAGSGGANAARARLRQCAREVGTAYVLSALETLDALIARHYDTLDERVRARLDSDYLLTLELTTRELALAERDGGDVVRKASLCLRVINVVTHVVSANGQLRREQRDWDLEAEVAAMESMAALRGDVPGGIKADC